MTCGPEIDMLFNVVTLFRLTNKCNSVLWNTTFFQGKFCLY